MAERRYIGGSSIAAVMGVSEWRTPLSVWAELTGRYTPDPSINQEAKEIGTELEEYVAQKFAKKAHKEILLNTFREFRHEDYPFLRGHPDRFIVGDKALLECKTTSAWNRKAWDGERIPIDYVMQINWYLGLTGLKTGYLAVLIGGQRFLWKELTFDADLYDEQVKKAVYFWQEFVGKDVMPIATAADSDLLEALYPTSTDAYITPAEEETVMLEGMLKDRRRILEEVERAQLSLDQANTLLKQRIGNASGLILPSAKISWLTQERRTIDTDRLKADKLYDTYVKTISHRVLRIKEQVHEPASR